MIMHEQTFVEACAPSLPALALSNSRRYARARTQDVLQRVHAHTRKSITERSLLSFGLSAIIRRRRLVTPAVQSRRTGENESFRVDNQSRACKDPVSLFRREFFFA